MKTHFAPSAQIFPQKHNFWDKWPNFVIFSIAQNVAFMVLKQNDRYDLTVATQKSVWKTMQPDPRYIQICFLTFWAKPNCQPKIDLNQYLKIFALKPWDHASTFEYHEIYIPSVKKWQNFAIYLKKIV